MIGALTVVTSIFGPLLEWPYWPWCLPIGVVLIGLSLMPWAHERADRNRAEKALRVSGTSTTATPTPSPTMDPNPVLVNMVYKDDKFLIFNLGKTNLHLWGTRLDGGKKSIGPAFIIAPDPKGVFIPLDASVQREILSKVHGDKIGRTPFTLYLKNDVSDEYIARFTLLLHNKSGALEIVTQLNEIEKHRWSDPPRTTEHAATQHDESTLIATNVRTGEVGVVATSLAIATDDEQTEYLLTIIDLFARNRGSETMWLSPLLDPANRYARPWPPQDRQIDYVRAIHLLADDGAVRIISAKPKRWVDLIGVAFNEDVEFERLNRPIQRATITGAPAPIPFVPAPVHPTPRALPGLAEARLTKIADHISDFVAQRGRAHPLGVFRRLLEANPIALLVPLARGYTTDDFARGRTYDAETVALYSSRYGAKVRAARKAVKRGLVSDPAKEALILEGPTQVWEIEAIAIYLRALVVPAPPPTPETK